jgi:iron complex transport system substrate-binding protein
VRQARLMPAVWRGLIWGWLLCPNWNGAFAAEAYYLESQKPASMPQRVVSLAPNLTEMIFALELGDRVVGVTRYDDFPAAVTALPKVGGFIDPNLEAIIALHPDLVVCVPNSGEKDRLVTLTKLRTPVLVLPTYGLEDIFTSMETLGKLFDQSEKARRLVADLRSHIDRLAKMVAGATTVKVMLVYGHRPLVVAGKGSFGDSLLARAGGINIVGDSAVPYPTLSMEEVIRLKPEVIIDASMSGSGAEMTASEVRSFWERWMVIPAIKSNRVHLFDSSVWFRAGPRIGAGLEELIRIVHPELFSSTRSDSK